jgi:hypothetical protein
MIIYILVLYMSYFIFQAEKRMLKFLDNLFTQIEQTTMVSRKKV